MRVVSPGDDEVPVPPPMDEVPPYDRFCDLVMTGGVASGVVYPWAIVELAREYRFRNIGGTSVGAMAAVLAAAAEYGRRVGFQQSFEVLRRTPGALGEVLPDGRTRMWSLFQANQKGQRLMRLWGLIGQGRHEPDPGASYPPDKQRPMPPLKSTFASAAREVVSAYKWPIALGTFMSLIPWLLAEWFFPSVAAKGLSQVFFRPQGPELASVLVVVSAALRWLATLVGAAVVALAIGLLGGLLGLLFAICRDIRFGVIDNNLGLCKGGTFEPPGPEGKRPGLSDWLHEGIQASAGLKATDKPLTFRDLWCAPAMPGAPHLRCVETDPARQRSIDLQLITTNVTHGRPYRLPLEGSFSRLHYKKEELRGYFADEVLEAMVARSRRYEKNSDSDPESIPNQDLFYELPGIDLPLVVAARMSMSFPLLLSAVPLWALDYEAARGEREMRRCLFADGGAASNFPIHLFDAAMPRWPTFGLWLDRKLPNRPLWKDDKDPRSRPEPDVWLPDLNEHGRAESWNRFDPLAADPRSAEGVVPLNTNGARIKFLLGFLGAIGKGAFDWRDRTNMGLPHMRNRVARLRLERGEGGLHIGMSRRQILSMAHRYGTVTGKLFVDRFAERDGEISVAWREQRWVRLGLLIEGLRERLDGLKASAELSAHNEPLTEIIDRATRKPAIRQRAKSVLLDQNDAKSLNTALTELIHLEAALQETKVQASELLPKPELRLRAPL